MNDRPDEAESWTIGRRAGRTAGFAAIMIPAGLLIIVAVAGWLYDRDIRPKTHQPITTFPAPGIETFIHDGAGDPPRPVPHAPPDGRIVAAKRAIVAEGVAGWGR